MIPDMALYTFFLAHAHGDAAWARRLYDALQPEPCFLDQVSLGVGEDWQRAIPDAQHRSRATVVLLSPRAPDAWYLQAEVMRAIELVRAGSHRVFPVWVSGPPSSPYEVPYGLESIQALDGRELGPVGTADALRALVQDLPTEALGSRETPGEPWIEVFQLARTLPLSSLRRVASDLGAPTFNFRVDHPHQLALDLVMWAETRGQMTPERFSAVLEPELPNAVPEPVDVYLSHAEPDGEALFALQALLRQSGYSVDADQRLDMRDWKYHVNRKIAESKAVIVLWSEAARASETVRHEMEEARRLGRLLVAALDDAPLERGPGVPEPLDYRDHASDDRLADSETGADRIRRALRERGVTTRHSTPRPGTPAMPTVMGDFPPAPPRLVGRSREMRTLHQLWDSGARVVAIHALGGAGKSALARAWLDELLTRDHGLPTRVYCWSAYSLGAGDNAQVNADAFLARALDWFGDPRAAQSGPPKDSRDRAIRLGEVLTRERALLVLDGLEPLQLPPTISRGRIEDRGLAELIKVVAASSRSMILATSRQPIFELGDAQDSPGPQNSEVGNLPLEELGPVGGADLLEELGVRGPREELELASKELLGHALSISLLGTYLRNVHGGAIGMRQQFDFPAMIGAPEERAQSDDTERKALRVQKIVRGYLEQFSLLAHHGAAGAGRPERVLLRLMGLFDRKAPGHVVQRLLDAPAIAGLTDELHVDEPNAKQRGQRISRAKGRLRQLGLIAQPDADDHDALDAHPIIRSYFRQELETESPAAFREANRRLSKHYASRAPHHPNTLEEATELVYAIEHGVRSGDVGSTFETLYKDRLQRQNQEYVGRVLRGYGTELSALAPFFKDSPPGEPWSVASPALGSNRRIACHHAARAMRGQGRLEESIRLYELSGEQSRRAGSMQGASSSLSSLSQLYLSVGRLDDAEEAGDRSVTLGSRSKHQLAGSTSRALRARIALARRDFEKAESLLREAERHQRTVEPDKPMLYDYRGLPHCVLRLEQGRFDEVLERVEYALSQHPRNPATRGEYLLLRARARHAKDPQTWSQGISDRDEAVKLMVESNDEDKLALGHLARAALRRRVLEHDRDERHLRDALEDLQAVSDLATASDLALVLVDHAIEEGLLIVDANRVGLVGADALERSAECAEVAGRRMEQMGYRLPEPALEQLRNALGAHGA